LDSTTRLLTDKSSSLRFFFFSSRRRHTRFSRDWSSDVCSSDLRDCLLAGYYCIVLEIDGTVSGYSIMSIAAAEAHVLNICVHPRSEERRVGKERRARWSSSHEIIERNRKSYDTVWKLPCKANKD